MTDAQIRELAAILVNEYGYAAKQIARARRDQHRHAPQSDSYRLWAAIAAAVGRSLARRRRSKRSGYDFAAAD
jgi:hypothetical protein